MFPTTSSSGLLPVRPQRRGRRTVRAKSLGTTLGILAFGAFAFAFAGPLDAQSPIFSKHTLIGWAASGTSTTQGTVDIQPVFPSCSPDLVRCKPVFVNNLIRWAGGTAYDSSTQAVWSSDGNLLEGRLVKNCKVLCTMKATKVFPVSTTRSVVSGLAISDRKKRLFQLETYPGHFAIVTYAPNGSCWKPISKCTRTLGGNWLAGGLAYDEVRDLLYITISAQNAAGSWQNILYVSKANQPCNIICKHLIKQCGNAMIQGLAYDCCSRVLPGTKATPLYATYGNFTQRIFVFDPLKCQFKDDPSCCKKGHMPWRGLALVPSWKIGKKGKPCSGKPCPNCPNMFASLGGGDPALGNSQFRVNLNGAPAGKIAFLVLNGGGCTNGVQFSSLCGPLYPALVPSPLFLGPHLIAGSGCFGSTKQGLPLPSNPALCGRAFCGQFLVICIQIPAIGFSLSNAVEFTITSS